MPLFARLWGRRLGKTAAMVESTRALNIESQARVLVQTIARYEAARQACRSHSMALAPEYGRLRRTMLLAMHQKDAAVILLRRELGLPDHPTQAECGT